MHRHLSGPLPSVGGPGATPGRLGRLLWHLYASVSPFFCKVGHLLKKVDSIFIFPRCSTPPQARGRLPPFPFFRLPPAAYQGNSKRRRRARRRPGCSPPTKTAAQRCCGAVQIGTKQNQKDRGGGAGGRARPGSSASEPSKNSQSKAHRCRHVTRRRKEERTGSPCVQSNPSAHRHRPRD